MNIKTEKSQTRLKKMEKEEAALGEQSLQTVQRIDSPCAVTSQA